MYPIVIFTVSGSIFELLYVDMLPENGLINILASDCSEHYVSSLMNI